MCNKSKYYIQTHTNSLAIAWGTDNGDSFIQHDLIGAVGVQINTGHESTLGRMGLCM